MSPIRRRPPSTGAAARVERLAQAGVERVDPQRALVDRARTPGCRRPGRRRSGAGSRSVTSETTSSSAAAGLSRSIRNRSRVSSSAAANDGGSPWRTACAPRTIMLPAAWRKMCVSSATGTGRASTSSANGLPAPTGASWSASPTSTTCVRGPDRVEQRHQQLEVGHRGLVDDQQVRRSSSSTVGPEVGHPAERGVDGRGVAPGRLGHPPRGAAGRRDEQDRRVLRLGGGADQPDRRGLAGARAAGDDRHPRRERGSDRRRLLGRRHEVVAVRRSPAESTGSAPPARARARRAPPRARRSRAGRPRPRRRRRPPPRRRPPSRRTARRSAAAPRAARRARVASTATGRHVEPLRSASPSTCMTAARVRARGVGRDAGGARDRVGDLEADAEHAGQVVRAAADHLLRAVAVLLDQARHEPGEAVRRQQQVQRAGRAQRRART